MPVPVRRLTDADLDAVVAHLCPDWRTSQARAIEEVCHENADDAAPERSR